MFKRKAVPSAECDASPQRKKCCLVFKEEWMKEIVEAETQKSRSKVRMQLGELFQYSPDVGLICKACAEAKIVGDFSTGKKWSDGWKLDYLKRHLISKVHESAMVILRNRSAAARFGFGVRAMLTETATDKANRMEVVERQRSLPEEIKILINNVLLTVKMNTSMLSVQDIHDHLALYVKIPDSWRSKNYAFEFLQAINGVIHCEAMAELRNTLYHTLIIDESTDISVTKMLILYFKFRPVPSTEHKTLFGGIVKLTSCNAEAITTAVKEFYTANELDLMKMVMFTSDGASVMLGKNNGVATRLKQSIPHLVEQHCVAHREDLGVDDAWKRVPMIKEMETLLRTAYTVFSRSSARKSKLDEMASVTDCEVVSFRPLNEVRWLSRHFAVGALIRNYEAVLKYFEHEKVEENDPVDKYCYKKLSDSNYRISLADYYDGRLSCPIKKLSRKGRASAPWFTDTPKSIKLACKQAERKWRRGYKDSDRLLWKLKITKYKTLIHKSKAEYFCSTICNASNSSRSIFNILNSLTSPDCSKNSIPTSQELCENLAKFFREKIEIIINDLKIPTDSSCSHTLGDQALEGGDTGPCWQPADQLSEFLPFGEEDFSRLARGISSGSPLDPVPHKIWKEYEGELFPTLCLICNQSLASGTVPARWKQALVSPLLKKPSLDPECSKNYRPISLLPFPAKIVERRVSVALSKHLEQYQQLEELQFGFRPAHGTVTALVTAMDELQMRADRGQAAALTCLPHLIPSTM
ncbi:uncharacterized protein LOC144762807 [Lissotriton helveticus]